MTALAMAHLFGGLSQGPRQRQGTGTIMLQQMKRHA
jgi:hypothetical protein